MTNPNTLPTLPEWPARLRDMITEYFNLDELTALCFSLGIDIEDFDGGKPRKVVQFLAVLADNGRLPDLLDRCQQERPQLDWQSIRDALMTNPALFQYQDERDQTQADIHNLVQQIAEKILVNDAQVQDIENQPPEAGEPPYPGLQHFTEADADHFFGRELLTAQVINRLHDERFLAIIGASGSGKSSLVRAGVIPALRRGEMLANKALPPANSRQWLIRIFTPTAHPLDALAAALTQDSDSITAVIDLHAALRQNNRALTLAAQQLLARHSRPRLLLVIDQFEEIFTLCRQPDERKAFIDNLVTAVAPEDNAPITILTTMRAEFYGQCAQDDNLRRLVSQHQEYIGAMNREELARAIVQPAALGNWRIQEGLVEQMLDDVGYEPGALPLLSHALLETWARRRGRTMTLSGYRESGGVRGAIAQTAEAIFQQRLTPQQQPVARMIFVRLTELGESVDGFTPDTRRRAAFSELITRTTDPDMLNAVLDILTQSRLVTTDLLPPDETKVVEVSHEALIREWPTLRHWLNQDRENLIRQRQLTDDVNEWLKLERDPGALYRGARLQQTQQWANAFPEPLNAEEQEFLEASQAAAQAEAEREARLARSQRTQRIMVTAVAILIFAFIGGIIYIFSNPGRTASQLETMVTPTICIPQTMPGDFNIAIAEFAVLDETGSLDSSSRAGQQLAGRVQNQLQTAFANDDSIAVWADSDDLFQQFCAVIGPAADDLAGVAAPADLAAQLEADVVIYGTIRPVGDRGELQLKFHLAPQLGIDASGIVGAYTFEKPAPIFDMNNPGSEVDAVLGPQTEALARTARGFTREMLGLQEEALADFEQAAAAAPDSSFTHFFVGQENLFLSLEAEGDEALAYETAAEAAFNRAQDNARAQIGLGGIHFLRAQRLLAEALDDNLTETERLLALESAQAEAEEALARYTAVIAGGSQIETYGVPVDVYAGYGAGITRRLLGEIAFEQGDPVLAEQLINEAGAALTALEPILATLDDYRLQAQAYQALGVMYEWQRFLREQRGDAAGSAEAVQNARTAYTKCVAVGEAFPFDTDVVDAIVEEQCRPRLEQLPAS